MFRKVLALALALGLIVPGLHAGKLGKMIIEKKVAVKNGYLDLRNLGLKDEDLEDLGVLGGELPQVTTLDLRNNDLEVIDLEEIGLKNLETVYVRGNAPFLELYSQLRGQGEKNPLAWVLIKPTKAKKKISVRLGPWYSGRGAKLGAYALTLVGVVGFGHWLNKKFSVFDRVWYGVLNRALPHARRQEIADRYHDADKDDRPGIEKKIYSVFSKANADAIMDTEASKK